MELGNVSPDGSDISGLDVSSTMIPAENGTFLLTPEFFIRAIVGTSVLLVTFLGNVLVLYVFATTRRLQTYTNYYIVGLAIADLVSGGITPALENVYWVLDVWPFGEGLCTATVYINHLFLHATFLMTLTICIDRYRALTMPLRHLREKTLKHALLLTSISYAVPFLIWTPLIIILPYAGVMKRVQPPFCHGSYGFYFPLIVFTIAVLSWIPMAVTVLLYIFVFRAVLRGPGRRSERYETRDNHQSLAVNSEMRSIPRPVRQLEHDGWGNTEGLGRDISPEPQTSGGKLGPVFKHPPNLIASSRTVGGIENEAFQSNCLEDGTEMQQAARPTGEIACDSRQDESAFKANQPSVVSSRHHRRLASLRATRTLTYILVVMVVSALPWSIFALWGVLSPNSVPEMAEFKTMSWLVHLSSAANPFCYAVCNPLFKQAFLRVLCCRRRGH